MKKIIALVLATLMLVCTVVGFSSCNQDTIIVQTNAFFAPFEYYEGTEIVGVDVEIMAMVGERLGKNVQFDNVSFSAIIDNVKEGTVCDAGAAGITITDSRKEKVDFSIPYYTSVQYVIIPVDSTLATKTVDGVEYMVWEALAGKTIGVQMDTTGYIYTDGEINATEDNDYGYAGVLYGTDTVCTPFSTAQLAADGITANQIDAVIVDELPAQYIVSNNSSFKCVPLYYSGETDADDAPVMEDYAICVTKGNTELLDAINAVLTELLVEDENGVSQIEKMVMRHMGMEQ
ncbi:MAG: transporter substrate-binding domain-containing protein [Clostridia bacterium]|nr:transporter substrate-binding domain-containing protein [Clostridia bacterium]MBQ7907873.1 transporter substrate-binding domain-containing protein [Clostridia bacterium]